MTARMLSPRDIARGRFITAEDICADLDVSLATAYRYMREMYALRTGGTVRVECEKYDAWLRANTTSPDGKPLTDAEWAMVMGRERRSADVGPFVYFIRCGDFIKIGWTQNHPRRRLGRLQTGSPLRMQLVGFVRGGERLEQDLHKLFRRDRERGEWFRETPALVAHIAKLLEGV